MIKIVKQVEPRSLVQHRGQGNAGYNNLPTETKEELRRQLLTEQGHLCAYCMQRIEEENSKIEHWHCQSKYAEEQLDYQNILAVCQGNEGQPKTQQHCDTKKGDIDFKCHPAESSHQYLLTTLSYLGSGKIQSTDKELNEQLETVLNLNISRLMDNRKSIITAVAKELNSKVGSRTQKEIQRLLDNWQQKDDKGKYQEYCGVAIYFLNKKLKIVLKR